MNYNYKVSSWTHPLGHKTLDTTLFYSHSKERVEKLLKTIKKIL